VETAGSARRRGRAGLSPAVCYSQVVDIHIFHFPDRKICREKCNGKPVIFTTGFFDFDGKVKGLSVLFLPGTHDLDC